MSETPGGLDRLQLYEQDAGGNLQEIEGVMCASAKFMRLAASANKAASSTQALKVTLTLHDDSADAFRRVMAGLALFDPRFPTFRTVWRNIRAGLRLHWRAALVWLVIMAVPLIVALTQ